jgi:putative transposase
LESKGIEASHRRAYDGNELRRWLKDRGTKSVIPNRSNRKQPFSFNGRLYKERRRIENAFGRLKDFRRIATRYDRLARNFLVSVCLVAALVRPGPCFSRRLPNSRATSSTIGPASRPRGLQFGNRLYSFDFFERPVFLRVCRYWSEKFGVSADELKRVVLRVGPIADDVAQGGLAKPRPDRRGFFV